MVGPVLALTGSTGQARRNADLDAVRTGACDRLSGFSSPAPGRLPGGSLLEARTCLRFVWSIIGAACALASVTDGEIMAREIRRYVLKQFR